MTINIRRPGVFPAKALRHITLGICTAFATVASVAIAAEAATPASDEVNEATGSVFGYLWIAGAAFHPLDNATTYSYPGSGCISKSGGPGTASPLFTHKVVLPDGAVARYLRLYYYDNSTSEITAFFTTYDGAGNFNERTNVASTDTGGFGSTLSPLFGYEVDQSAASINVTVNMGTQNDSTLRFCGARIAYDPPVTDRIFANGFEFIPL